MSDEKMTKACPFCGGSAQMADTSVNWLVCDDCGAEGPVADSEREAIEKWNARKWDEGEHEGCGIDSQRALERQAAAPVGEPMTVWSRALEVAAKIAETGCLVPPDGGSPTEEEREMCESIASSIRVKKLFPPSNIASPPPSTLKVMEVSDEMIEAACKVRHSPQSWGRTLNKPDMADWIIRQREDMRKILTAALDVKPGEQAAPFLLEKIEAEARRYAEMYPPSSDGRNTFVIFADWVAALSPEVKNQDQTKDETSAPWMPSIQRMPGKKDRP